MKLNFIYHQIEIWVIVILPKCLSIRSQHPVLYLSCGHLFTNLQLHLGIEELVISGQLIEKSAICINCVLDFWCWSLWLIIIFIIFKSYGLVVLWLFWWADGCTPSPLNQLVKDIPFHMFRFAVKFWRFGVASSNIKGPLIHLTLTPTGTSHSFPSGRAKNSTENFLIVWEVGGVLMKVVPLILPIAT